MRRSSSPGRDVPRLHPGVNDLIRVLGKQAHCSSRILISCEPNCFNTHLRSKYHKNCVSTKTDSSWEPLSRPSSLWSPIQLDSYYYDCFFYRQYPDRDSEYQEILEKYNAIKEHDLDYSPPDCDEDLIRAIISDPTMESERSLAGRNEGISDHGAGPGTFRGKDDEYSFSSKKPLGSSSRRNMVSEGDSVSCSELAEIRDLLKQSDRETIRRLQEMLALMKELSIRDICRAKCGGSMSQGSRKSSRRDDSRRQIEETDDYDDFERQESEIWKPNKRGTQEGTPPEIKITVHSDIAAGHYSAEPAQYSNRSLKQLQGSSKKSGQVDGYASDDSSTSVGKGGSGKGERPSSRTALRKGNKGGYDTDPTASSSSLSQYSTDGSRHDLKGSGEEESDLGSSDESRRSHGKQSSSKRKLNEHSSSETVSMEGSKTSVCRSRGHVDGRDPRASKQSGISHTYGSGPYQHGSGGNFKLTVGKYQLTVHEAVDLANKITDIIVLETMDELIRKGLYVPPSIRYDRPTSSVKKLDRIDETSSRAMLSKTSLKKPVGSTLDTGKDGSRRSQQESKRLSCPRHSRSLSPPASRGRFPSRRLEEDRERARSADYRKSGHSSVREPPKPWERRLSSQLKLDSLMGSSTLRKLESSRGSKKDGSQRSNAASLRNDRPSQKALVLEPLAESSKLSTATYKTNRGISDDGNRGSIISRVSKTKSDRGLDPRLDQSSFRQPDQVGSKSTVAGQKHSVQSSRPGISQDSQRRIQQYKTTTQDSSEVPRSRQSSKISQMSHFSGSYRSSKNSQMSKTLPERGQSLLGPSSKTLFDVRDKARPVSASSGQINQGINIQPTSVTEKEVAGGRVLSFTRTENVNVFVPETGSIKALSGGPQLTRIASACEPDDLIATTYDTDDSILYFARITRNAFPPVKESYNAAGFMLRSAYDYSIPPRNKVSVKTDLVLQLPRNSYGRIAPRKCLVESYGIDVGADVIDRDFRGNITVVLFNHGDTTFAIKRGNKVALLICESIRLAKVQENCSLLEG